MAPDQTRERRSNGSWFLYDIPLVSLQDIALAALQTARADSKKAWTFSELAQYRAVAGHQPCLVPLISLISLWGQMGDAANWAAAVHPCVPPVPLHHCFLISIHLYPYSAYPPSTTHLRLNPLTTVVQPTYDCSVFLLAPSPSAPPEPPRAHDRVMTVLCIQRDGGPSNIGLTRKGRIDTRPDQPPSAFDWRRAPSNHPPRLNPVDS